MSAIATVLHAMGHTLTGSDLRASAGDRAAAPRRGAGGHRPPGRQHRRRRSGHRLLGRGRRQSRAGRGPTTGITVLTRAETLAPWPLSNVASPWPAPTARRPPPPCWPSSWSTAGRRPPSSSAAMSTRSAPTRCGTTASGWWSRRTRATALSCPWTPDIAVVTNVEADHLDYYGSFAALRRPSRSSWPVPTSTGWWVGTTRWPPPSVGPPAPTPSGPRRSAPTGWWTWRWPAARCPSAWWDRTAPSWADWPFRSPVSTTPATPRVATVASLAAGGSFDAAARALARFAGVARRFEFRGDAHGVTFVDDYAHLPGEVRGRPGRRPPRGLATGGGRVPAPPLQPDRRVGGRVRPGLRPTPTWWWSPTSTVPVRPPVPGVTGELVADAIRRSSPAGSRPLRPEPQPSCVAPWRPSSRRGTSV